jgi:hypothetical protein
MHIKCKDSSPFARQFPSSLATRRLPPRAACSRQARAHSPAVLLTLSYCHDQPAAGVPAQHGHSDQTKVPRPRCVAFTIGNSPLICCSWGLEFSRSVGAAAAVARPSTRPERARACSFQSLLLSTWFRRNALLRPLLRWTIPQLTVPLGRPPLRSWLIV